MREDTEELKEAIRVGGLCRDMRHAWDSRGDVVLIEQNGQIRHFARTLECMRCETARIDEYTISNFSLSRVRSRYRYSQGYHIKGGIPVDEVRFRLFRDAEMVLAEDVHTVKEDS